MIQNIRDGLLYEASNNGPLWIGVGMVIYLMALSGAGPIEALCVFLFAAYHSY